MLIHEPIIYTTGAELCPAEITVDGNVRWVWVVIDFTDDSFKDGDVYNPQECANTKAELLRNCRYPGIYQV